MRHLHYRVARRGESFDLGSTHVKVLAPELPLLTGTASDINNNSVVLCGLKLGLVNTEGVDRNREPIALKVGTKTPSATVGM